MEPPKPELSRVEALQLIALGAILASKEFRRNVKPSMFSFWDFQRAAEELIHGYSYHRLSRILRDRANVNWPPSLGSPLQDILKALDRDGNYALHMNVLNTLIQSTCNPENFEFHKDEFMGRVASLAETVKFRRMAIDDPRKANEWGEKRLQEMANAGAQDVAPSNTQDDHNAKSLMKPATGG